MLNRPFHASAHLLETIFYFGTSNRRKKHIQWFVKRIVFYWAKMRLEGSTREGGGRITWVQFKIKSDPSAITTLSPEKKVGGRNLVFVDSSEFFRININKMLMCSTLGNEQMTLAEWLRQRELAWTEDVLSRFWMLAPGLIWFKVSSAAEDSRAFLKTPRLFFWREECACR